MSSYICSDLHLGHKNISKFRKFVTDSADNTNKIVNCWRETIRKQDIVFCLGDVAFDKESLDILGNLKGRKVLIKGNHDDFISTKDQANVFEEIHGILQYKGMWLTHCPIHPAEMRKRKGNAHGHTHNFQITKGFGPFKKLHPKYLNCCVDQVWSKKNSIFYSLDDLKSYFSC
jgi:calcineurin-like phosphoesterase family protein